MSPKEPDFPTVDPPDKYALINDWDQYSRGYSEGDYNAWIPEWFTDAMQEAGYDNPADAVGANFVLHRDMDDNWWGEVNGEVVTPIFSSDNNSDLWDIYDWWNEYGDEPPERDIESGEPS